MLAEFKSPVVIAAIDVGSSAIRMEVSEVRQDGSLRTLESLSKGVSIGKDTFTSGRIEEETIQTACKALEEFSRVMKVYGVAKYRAVGTSAVREANNADTFLDRAFMRSGIDVEVIDGSEENRLSYLAIHEALKGSLDLQSKNALIVEVGGGSTDISFLKGGETQYSGTFALGAVRLRQALAEVKGDLKNRVKILDRQIKNTINTINSAIPLDQISEIVALGGDIRFAARQIMSSGNGEPDYWVLDRKEFNKFCNEIAKFETEDLVKKYGLGYAQADTVVPALLCYRNLVEKTKAERIYVLSVSIRAGLLLDMARSESGIGAESLDKQIIASARALARKYHAHELHVEQVRNLSLQLFDQMKSDHGLHGKERLLLEVAAILHDVGSFISTRSHHKHSQYIISASDIFGLSRADMNLIANIARYHRKSPPNRAHLPYVSLDRESRMIVSKLASLLRIADALEQEDSNKVKQLRITREDENDRFILEVEADGDLTMEKLAVESKSDLFTEIYGKPVILRQVDRSNER
jgi:exopolyphosphatase/guanosine-5'-triphosphate,3'-diphosphate pyrophosphatase